jgi:hypothetical protein
MARRLILSGLLLLSLVSCGYYEGVVQPTPKSYVAFTGNTVGASAVIDGAVTLDLDREMMRTEGKDRPILFQIVPGRHRIIVTRMGREVVNRLVIIADGATQEILIP